MVWYARQGEILIEFEGSEDVDIVVDESELGHGNVAYCNRQVIV